MATNFEFYLPKMRKAFRETESASSICDMMFGTDYIGDCSKDCRDCIAGFIEYLATEHIEQPKLTKRERAFCEAVQTGWIARDEGYLYWHIVKPIKDGAAFIFPNSEDSVPMVIKTKGLAFDVIKNKEMMAVADLLEMEVQHETD